MGTFLRRTTEPLLTLVYQQEHQNGATIRFGAGLVLEAADKGALAAGGARGTPPPTCSDSRRPEEAHACIGRLERHLKESWPCRCSSGRRSARAGM